MGIDALSHVLWTSCVSSSPQLTADQERIFKSFVWFLLIKIQIKSDEKSQYVKYLHILLLKWK